MGPSAQATLYTFVLISSILHGPICAHRGNDGLIMLIGSILHEQCCANSFSLAVLFMVQQLSQFKVIGSFLWAGMGPFVLIGSFP